MHILERLEEYSHNINTKPYIYGLQRQGIDILKFYVSNFGLDISEEDFREEMLDKLVLYWFPKNKKYLSESEAYQVIYTIQDFCNYVYKNRKARDTRVESSSILMSYGEAYMRVFKLKSILYKLTRDPVIHVSPLVVDINRYKEWKRNEHSKDIGTTYIQAFFKVEECKEGGQVILSTKDKNKEYKLLLEYPAYKYMEVGDILQATIKRKLFYVYWEIDEVKGYYLPAAQNFCYGIIGSC